jgi:hypothetical protein
MKKLIALALLLGCGVAQAIPVTWTVTDATQDYTGTPITGSFTYDADTNSYTNISLVTSWYSDTFIADHLVAGEPGFIHASSDSNGAPAPCGNIGVCAQIRFWTTPLTNAGGTIVIDKGEVTMWGDGVETGANEIVTGTLVANVVPIPAAAYLFASGLGLLGWFRRR